MTNMTAIIGDDIERTSRDVDRSLEQGLVVLASLQKMEVSFARENGRLRIHVDTNDRGARQIVPSEQHWGAVSDAEFKQPNGLGAQRRREALVFFENRDRRRFPAP